MPTGRVPGPLEHSSSSGRVHKSARPHGSVHTHIDTSSPESLDFMDRVLKAAIADRFGKGRQYFPEIDSGALAKVEKGKVMRTEAAAQCVKLLKAAREDLATEQMGPPPDIESMKRQDLARTVRSIGITSAYRTNSEEQHIWKFVCFPKYYAATEGRRSAAAGGPHGDRAVRIMVDYFTTRKAPPGFSNHSNGKAVDFMTTQGKATYTANTSQRAGWRGTWLHMWLLKHAKEYRFFALDSEEWHWDYR